MPRDRNSDPGSRAIEQMMTSSTHERLRKVRRKAAWVGLSFLFATAALNAWIILSGTPQVYARIDDLPPNEVGLLLGAPPRLRGGRLSPYFEGRIDAAARLYHSGKIKHLLISGDELKLGETTLKFGRQSVGEDANALIILRRLFFEDKHGERETPELGKLDGWIAHEPLHA